MHIKRFSLFSPQNLLFCHFRHFCYSMFLCTLCTIRRFCVSMFLDSMFLFSTFLCSTFLCSAGKIVIWCVRGQMYCLKKSFLILLYVRLGLGETIKKSSVSNLTYLGALPNHCIFIERY